MASAKATTRKLTGRAKKNFFSAGMAPEELDAAVTSLQVRKDAWPVSKDLQSGRSKITTPPAVKTRSHSKDNAPTSKTAAKSSNKGATSETAQTPPPATANTAQTSAFASDDSFDPFAFGLIPIFKREGAKGLAARLEEIGNVENLRAMAKAQQIVLPRDVRRGEADIDTVRTAVLAAVEQRITDRKAQL